MPAPLVALLVVAQTPLSAPAPAAAASKALAIVGSKALIGLHPLAFAPSPTGKNVAMAMEDTSIRVIDASTKMTLKQLSGHKRPPQAIAWSPNGRWIASGDEGAHIFIWDTKTWKRVKDIVGHTRPIQALAFNASSTQLVSTGQDDVVKIWEMKDLSHERISLQGGGANFFGAKFVGRSNDFAMGTLQQGARLYTEQKTMRGWLTGHANQGVLAVDFNPPATLAVTAGRDNRASIFDVKKMARIGSLKGHEDWVINAIFSPNGQWVVTSSSDRTVKVWNPKTYTKVIDIPDQKSVGSPLAFTADGKYLFTVDISDNLVVHTLNPPQPVTAAKASTSKTKKKRRGG